LSGQNENAERDGNQGKKNHLRTFSSHGVARESSPWRKPWVEITPIKAPSGATEISSPEFFFRRYAAWNF
jgi:hypothetical protein